VRGSGTRDLLRKVRGLPSKSSPTSLLTDEDRKKVVALYDGAIRYTDRYIGRLSALLSELGLAQNTVLVVLSDHGEEFWDHGSVIHAHALYEEQVRVPLIWRLPGKDFAGKRLDAVVRLLDVGPTVLDLLGLEAQAEFYGRSLLPMMRGADRSSGPALSEIRLKKSWTAFPWKLHTDGKTGEVRLFHLVSDPEEKNDVAEANPDVVRSLWMQTRAYLKGESSREILELDPEIEDEALRKQLRALGYIE
jgi:arylsulfatase A-like enzyme